MKYLSKESICNKKVILRCDFNVSIKDNKILDDSKIIKSLDTINYLLKHNNQVIILSHFGRIKSESDKGKNSLIAVCNYLNNYIDTEFIDDPLDINVKDKKCYLVENTRYTDLSDTKESDNNLELAKYWSTFGDVFVIDAFGSLHRAHSSTAGISKYLDTYIGFLVEKELKYLDIVKNPKKPFVVIMGGFKLNDKIKIIESILKKCDYLVLTGGILNTFLNVMGYNTGKSIICDDLDILKMVKDIIDKYSNKIKYSNLFVVESNGKSIYKTLEEIDSNDIIYDNIIDNVDVINKAKTIFMNGTCGLYEDDNYSLGTKRLLEDLTKVKGKVVIGGGDTVSAVNKFKHNNDYTYLSSGGGATLEYVAYDKLKALEFIEKYNK